MNAAFKIEKTGTNYQYSRYQRNEVPSLECLSENYYIMTNIDNQKNAEKCIDGLLCCINQVDEGLRLTISLNDKTNCYDISLSLEEMELPELLIFENANDLMKAGRLDGNQRQKMYENAINKGIQELKLQK